MYRRQYGGIAKALIIVPGVLLFLSVTGTADSLSTNSPYVYFPENERFGYVTVDCPVSSEKSACYQIVARPDAASASRPLVFPHLFTSLLPPRMCDTNAVSLIAPGTERDDLVVATLAATLQIDTVFEFVPKRMRSKSSQTLPDTCIFTPHHYVYVSQTRILGCSTELHRPFIEIVRITGRTTYDRKLFRLANALAVANDFSRMFISLVDGVPLMEPIPQCFLSYEIARDTTILLYEGFGIGPPIHQRSSLSPIYCGYRSEELVGYNLVRIKGDSLVVLTDFTEPIRLSGFELYTDSIVVFHQRCCDADYGTRRLVIHE